MGGFLFMKLFTNTAEIGNDITRVTTAAQAILAANAGAAYVSVPLGELDETGIRGMEVVEELIDIFSKSELCCRIIADDVRSPIHVTRAARFGCYGAVVSNEIREKMKS
jgi:transaldolase